WISPASPNFRNLYCKNISQWDITITGIRCIPKVVGVASGDSARAVVIAANYGDPFSVVLKRDEQREFPIVISRGELLNADNTELAPFCLLVSWRKNSSPWLPQIPKLIISSMQTLRLLAEAK